MFKKKLVSAVLALSMVVGMCACGETTAPAATTPAATTEVKTEAPATTAATEAVSAEALAENVKVSIFIPSRKADYMYDNDTVTLKALAEKMNVTFDIETVINSEAKSKLSSIVSSGDIPDICAGNMALLKKFGADGAFVALDELIDDKYPNLKKYVMENPEVYAQSASSDGHLYVIPMLSAMKTAMGYMIRQDWLDDLGLQQPETIEDWYNVLTAFKNAKLNGGEVTPLFLDRAWELYYNNFSDAWGIEVNGNNDFWTVIDGQMVYAPATEQCKAYLTEMQKWYTEGLIDAEFITREDTCSYHVNNNMAGAGCYWIGYMAGLDPNWHVVAPPVLEEGTEPRTFNQQAKTVGYGWAISNNTEHLEKILELFDYVYSDEGSMLFNFGVENESYHYVNGVPEYTDKVLAQGSTTWVHSNGCLAYIGMRQLPAYERAQAAGEDAARQLFYYEDNNMFMPMNPVVGKYGEAQSRYTEIMTPILNYTEDELLKFFTGIRNMDEYDSFIKTLTNMGIGEAAEIQNDAYRMYLGNSGR